MSHFLSKGGRVADKWQQQDWNVYLRLMFKHVDEWSLMVLSTSKVSECKTRTCSDTEIGSIKVDEVLCYTSWFVNYIW